MINHTRFWIVAAISLFGVLSAPAVATAQQRGLAIEGGLLVGRDDRFDDDPFLGAKPQEPVRGAHLAILFQQAGRISWRFQFETIRPRSADGREMNPGNVGTDTRTISTVHVTFRPSLGAMLIGVRVLRFHAPVLLISGLGLERQTRTDNRTVDTVDDASGAVVKSQALNMRYVAGVIAAGVGAEVPFAVGPHLSVVPQCLIWYELGPTDCRVCSHVSMALSARWTF